MSQSTAHKRPPLRVAILGCGTVGGEIARILHTQGQTRRIEVVKILVRRTGIDRGVPASLFTTSFDEVLDARPDAIVEVLGGLTPAKDYIAEALERGIHVVTANKSLLAHHGQELEAIAARRGVQLRHEAAVCAGIPLFAALGQLRGDQITSIRGVVNGSCNFILTKIGQTGCSFAEALEEAKKLGLVEPDPSADISGRDSAEKLAVLAHQLGIHLPIANIQLTGIDGIGPDDLREARKQGRAIKLLAELEIKPEGVFARVGPTLLPASNPLAKVDAQDNAVIIQAALAGTIVLKGPGAGPKPTASAILGDLAAINVDPRRTPHHESPASDSKPRAAAVLVESSPRPSLVRIRAKVGATTHLNPHRTLQALNEDGIDSYEAVWTSDTLHLTLPSLSRERVEGYVRKIIPEDKPEFLLLPILAEPGGRPASAHAA